MAAAVLMTMVAVPAASAAPLPPVQTTDPVAPAAPAAAPGEEVVALRERFSETFATDDPSRFETKISAAPMHFKEGAGWAKIERNLRPAPGGRFDNGRRNDFVLSVASSQQDRQLARLEAKAGEAVAFAVEGARPGSASPDPTSAGQHVTYRSVLPHVDLQLTSLAQSLKEVLVLQSAKAPTRFVFPLTLEGLTARIDETGQVLYVNGAGETLFTTPRPWMTDSLLGPDRAGATSTEAAYRLIDQPGGGTALELTISPQWLNDPARVFPVKVDPTYAFQAFRYQDTYYAQNNTTNALTYEPYLWTGVYHGNTSYKNRAYLQFGEGSKITPGDGKHYVNSATFHAWQITTSNCLRDIYAKRVTQNWHRGPDAYAPQQGPTWDAYDYAVPWNDKCLPNNQGLAGLRHHRDGPQLGEQRRDRQLRARPAGQLLVQRLRARLRVGEQQRRGAPPAPEGHLDE